MKIRNGWVANSSSSSFIVRFSKYPKDEGALRELLFGDEKMFECYDSSFTTKEIAGIVWRELLDTEKNPHKEASKLLKDDVPYNLYEQFEKKEKGERWPTTDWDALQEHWNPLAKKKLETFLEGLTQEEFYCIFHYSDNDSDPYPAMEHGGLFDKLKHIRISHH